MRKHTVSMFAGMAALVALWCIATASIGATSAFAQCDSLTITNNAGCEVTLCFTNIPSNPTCVTIPAGRTVKVPVRQGWVPGVLTTCGTVATIPAGGNCIRGVAVTNNCCVDLCYHPSPCHVSIEPGTPPCSCSGHN